MAVKEGLSTLTYSVRLRVVAKHFGQLSVTLAALTLVPLAASLLFSDFLISVRYLLIIAGLAICAIPLGALSVPGQIQANEALVIIALIFIAAPLLMTYPMMGSGLPFMDALFESVSAATTTGLSTLAHVEDMPKTFLFARAWMQWYGGLGIVVLAVALLMGGDIAAARLTERRSGEPLVTTTRQHALRMVKVYSALTTAGFILIWLAQGDVFTSLVHTLSAVSTGGFSSRDGSLADFGWATRAAIIGVSTSGAISFPLYYLAYRRGWRALTHDIEAKALLLLGLAISIPLALSFHEEMAMAPLRAWANGLLIGFSAQSTAGFTTLNPADLATFSKLLLIMAMFVGGGLGSTAGGIKILRWLMLMRLLQTHLRRTTLPPHAVIKTVLAGRTIGDVEIQRVLVLIMLFIGAVLLSWLIFLGFGLDPMNSLFEVVSALGTVGLSTGISHADLHPLLKAVLCVDMLFGRLEIVAVLVLFYPPTWFGKRKD